jgi:hypothetical protein
MDKTVPSVTLLIVRDTADLSWIHSLPENFGVIIRNRGDELGCQAIRSRAVRIIEKKSISRRSASYLEHILSDDFEASEWTVFLGDYPFQYSPGILDLFQNFASWKPVQSLACRNSPATPPSSIIRPAREEYVARYPVRSELFGLRTLAPVAFHDEKIISVAAGYRHAHDLGKAANLISHFIELCGWPELAARAESSDLGRVAHGAMFAVNSRIAGKPPRHALEKMLWLSKAHEIYGHFFDRLWLHLFGMPFMCCGPWQGSKTDRAISSS